MCNCSFSEGSLYQGNQSNQRQESANPELEIVLRHFGNEYIARLSGAGITLSNVIETFLGLLVTATYSIDSIKEIMSVLRKNEIIE